ncbi:heptaprenyl diphosphate synthase component II [Lederbergia citrea]|uniref:Heptaprenyl diphosphate synthase component 2 n=1 Tax=Lederbergia citrea TaxID=2833581 RepID=A0A942UNY4_9BACI|nr:heptaprenyl diphosphate synthase component II [Lederbergia citrea]MBS4176564.1 heptaprenyl diphosphate synthase component II [Lederbergia citrea]MBS4203125.1 heptaprenyl diphosphate synthase component II [Lederbergia citrea]MBS4222203.1 heptaprenyl diphosphate synthase component II [Lederbergia citrea]
MKLTLLNSTFKADFDIIEKELEKAIQSEIELLQRASVQLLKAGGKRIRPVFVLLAAKFGSYNIHMIKNTAVALELIHMASLVHDDVIDDADIRRGQPTINYTWDDRIAMYTGDYILARSLDYMTNIRNPIAHQILSKAIIDVCNGEIEQIRDKYRFNQTLRDYLRRIKRKTALLIAVSCELGAVSAGTDEAIYKQLYKFGYFIGMSYQITDDILDFTGSEQELGKPAGEDLRQGNITLPVLYAMNDEKLKSEIIKINDQTGKKEMFDIISQIKKSGAIEQSHLLSKRYLQKALEVLDELPSVKAKKTLREIAHYIGKRKY